MMVVCNNKREVTIDDLLNKIAEKPTVRYILVILSVNLIWLGYSILPYSAVFAGVLPTDEDWSCNSTKCDNIVKHFNRSTGESPLCAEFTDANGDPELVLGPSDITWHPYRTSFAIDFDLYCSTGSRATLRTLISSFYYVGAFWGLVCGSFVFDNFGRKWSALVLILLNIIMTFTGTFCNSYGFLLTIRFFQGFGTTSSSTATYILAMELLPARLRNTVSGCTQAMWSAGYPIAVAIGYFCRDWHYIYLAGAICVLLHALPLLFIMESPRFYLINNNKAAAKRSLKFLAALNGTEIDLDSVQLVVDEVEGDSSERQQGFLQQVSEFYKYPVLLKETLLLMVLWFVVAMSYFGFSYGWGSIIPNLYIGYLLAAVGEFVGVVGIIPLVHYVGRRRSIILLLLVCCLTYLLAIPDVQLGAGWRLESIAGLIGICMISAVFTGIYLFTSEIAPTSHRGLVFCLSSSSGRVGSFFGPFIFNNITEITSRSVPLLVLAGLFVICSLCAFLLVETGGRDVPAVPQDVKERRKEWRWKL